MTIEAVVRWILIGLASGIACRAVGGQVIRHVKSKFGSDPEFLQLLKDGKLQRGDMFVEDYRDHPEDDGSTFTHIILENDPASGTLTHTLISEINLDEWQNEGGPLEVKMATAPDTDSYDFVERQANRVQQAKGHPLYRPKPQAKVMLKCRMTTEEREFTHEKKRPIVKTKRI